MEEMILEFYESDFDLLVTPEQLHEYLKEIHEEFDLSDLSSLLNYFEVCEDYEKCAVVVKFAKENNIKC